MQEDPDALYERSRRHGDILCPPQDAEHAAMLIQAAERGSVQAQRDLGCCYATGDDAIQRDLILARHWYGRAAEAGHADAQYNFGCMLLYGEGGAAQPEAGLDWIRRAAALGDMAAQRHLREQSPSGAV